MSKAMTRKALVKVEKIYVEKESIVQMVEALCKTIRHNTMYSGFDIQRIIRLGLLAEVAQTEMNKPAWDGDPATLYLPDSFPALFDVETPTEMEAWLIKTYGRYFK